ncbi:enterochelin esterase domain-containing protein [Propionicimonas sp.]|uniref:enterochelin esterase domain-containing protein n=1 Tax=Propionicimonas sp. TaxID=1955623 RepID=UPI0039E4A76A
MTGHRPTPPKVPRPWPAPLACSPAISALGDAVAADPSRAGRLVAEFWAGTPAPLVETDPAGECLVTFTRHDPDAEQVLLFVNRLTDERRLDDSLMQRLPGTALWHLTYRMGADWRASYAFLPRPAGARAAWRDDADQVAIRAALDHGLPDQRNRLTCRNRSGRELSVVELPQAPAQRWLTGAAPAGELLEHALPDGRTCWTYRPPGADGPLPVVVCLDGEVWLRTHNLPASVDALVLAGLIRPPLLVLVPSAGREARWADLGGDAPLVDWIADVLLPWLGERFDLGPAATDRIVAGQSLGGTVALLAATLRPDAVGGFISQSASLWQPGVLERVASGLGAGTRGHLEVGRQEWVLLGPHRDLRDRLAARGVRPGYVEFNGGHDDACWRGGMADALQSVLGAGDPPASRT